MDSNNFNDFNDLMAKMFGDLRKEQPEYSYREIRKLHEMLDEAKIPHNFNPHFMGGYQITYFGKKEQPRPKMGCISGPGVGAICSVIQTPISYGVENGKIEISGLLTAEELKRDGVVGNLTAEDVFKRIETHWNNET